MEKLKEIGQYASGTTEKIRMKLRRFCLFPKLFEKLKLKSNRSYSFKYRPYQYTNGECSWGKWRTTVSWRLQEKSLWMLQSRKIVSMKCMKENENITSVCEGYDQKAVWQIMTPALTLFENWHLWRHIVEIFLRWVK